MSSSAGTCDPRVARSRAAVLAATVDLMVERGVPAVTVDAIAERSGVAKTTIYRHWATREQVLADAWASLTPASAPEPTGDLDEDVHGLTRRLAERLDTPPFSVVLPDLLAAASRDPLMQELHGRLLSDRPRPIEHRFATAVAAGSVPADTDPQLVAAFVAGALLHRRLVAHLPLDTEYADRVAAATLIATRAGAFCRPSPPPAPIATAPSGADRSGARPPRRRRPASGDTPSPSPGARARSARGTR